MPTFHPAPPGWQALFETDCDWVAEPVVGWWADTLMTDDEPAVFVFPVTVLDGEGHAENRTGALRLVAPGDDAEKHLDRLRRSRQFRAEGIAD